MDLAKRSGPALTTFYVYLTEGCNCACRHCWIVSPSRTGGQPPPALLEPNLLRQAIDQALPLGLTALKWTGGEPTYHPRFGEFLALQKEFGLSGVLETNGMLVNGELAERLRDAGVDQVSVSLDGAAAATHEAIRGVPGGYAKTIAGIRALVASGYRPELILTLQRRNRLELSQFLDLAESLGAGYVKLNILQPVQGGASLGAKSEGLGVDEILEIAADIEILGREKTDLKVLVDLPMAFRPLTRIISGDHDGTCNLRQVLGILASGRYALCGIGQHVPELAMGSIEDTDLAELWEKNPILEALRDHLPEKLQGICGDCLMRTACLGSCVAVNYQLCGDLLAPHWFCTRAAELGRFPASRQQRRKT